MLKAPLELGVKWNMVRLVSHSVAPWRDSALHSQGCRTRRGIGGGENNSYVLTKRRHKENAKFSFYVMFEDAIDDFHKRFAAPDVAVTASHLFVYEPAQPGTGTVVTVIRPHHLPSREATIVDTPDLRISFRIRRTNNIGAVTLRRKENPRTIDCKKFRMLDKFRERADVSLTVLFRDWKVEALIDGEPLVLVPERKPRKPI